ncbi:MAG: hypothetical protein M3177_08845 [Pseudomonadota bacterium]|nr:hypothetical protein [Pseudomonadota bacterium]
MVNFTNFNRIATAAVGALVISTACIAAALGPAAATSQSVSYAAVAVPASAQASA